MPSFQTAAPGSKSSKITGLDPSTGIFAPFLAQPGDLDGCDTHDASSSAQYLSETMDRRLRLEQENHNGQWQQPQQQQQQRTMVPSQQPPPQLQQQQQVSSQGPPNLWSNPNQEEEEEQGNEEPESDSDDSDDDAFFLDDDPTLEAIRQKRLAELKQQHLAQQQQTSKKQQQQKAGYGEYRIISQDEFLPECNVPTTVVVHFYHEDFQKCQVMEHHLKRLAPLHGNVKFVGILAEKAPFFTAKFAIQTLPTLLVFSNGELMQRLTGFEGLQDDDDDNKKKKKDVTTSQLGRWLEQAGAIREYQGPYSSDEEEDDDDDDEGPSRRTISHRPKTTISNRIRHFND